MTAYAVIALLGVQDGRTDEAHAECDDLEEAVTAVRRLVAKRGRNWKAITIVHIEDYPKMLEGATSLDDDALDAKQEHN